MPTVPCLDEFDYVLKEERNLPTEARAVFRLRPLKYKEREVCERIEFRETPEGPVLVTEQLKAVRRVLNFGLVGWRGVKSADGSEVPFMRTKEGISEGCLDMIAPWANEIANAIGANSRMTEEQAKN